MYSLSDIKDKLDETMKYLINLKLYSEKTLQGEVNFLDREDSLKYIKMSMDNIMYILYMLSNSHSVNANPEDENKIIDYLVNSYIISDKCKNKIYQIKELMKEIESKDSRDTMSFERNLKIVSEYFDDVVDDIYDHVSY